MLVRCTSEQQRKELKLKGYEKSSSDVKRNSGVVNRSGVNAK